jgi:hypothetical protein
MNTNFEKEKSTNTEKGKNILIIVLIILIIISGIKLYSDSVNHSNKTEEILMLSEKNRKINERLDSITFQLDLRIQEIEKLGGDISSLQKIKDQLISERNLDKKRSADEIGILNTKINAYTTVLQEKDQEIIRLKEINQQLYTENKDLKFFQADIEDTVVKLNLKRKELEEKINIAARLKAENVIIAAVNSRGREREDGFRNRQLERLKITFTLADNKVAEKGPHNIYVQIIAPNNQPIFDIARGSGTFRIDGREEFYTVQQDILFNNTKQTLTYFYEKGSKYVEGTHQIRIFADDYQIGIGSFEIK